MSIESNMSFRVLNTSFMTQLSLIRCIRTLILAFAGLWFSSLLFAGDVKPGWHTERFFHQNTLREFRYFVPPIPGEERAVVLLFHPGGANMNTVFGKKANGANRWEDLAESEGFFLVIPNGTNLKTGEGRGGPLYWNDCRPQTELKGKRAKTDDVSFVRKVVSELHQKVEVDTSRVYATGTGEGGMMALRLAFEAPELVAAIAAVNSSIPLNTHCKRSKIPVPMLLMNGTKDEVFPWTGGQLDGRHGLLASIPKMRLFLTRYNRVEKEEQVSRDLSDKNPEDGCTVKRQFFPGSSVGADVCLFTIEGGGHTVPSIKYPQSKRQRRKNGNQSNDLEMAVEVWHFLSAYSLQQRVREKPM